MQKIILFASTILLTMVIFITSISSVSAMEIRQNLSIILYPNGSSIRNDLLFDPLDVEEFTIDNDNIFIKLSYGGGCRIHDFTLIGSNEFIETLPVQANIGLSHNSHGDKCEGLLIDTLKFDLTPLKEEYFAVHSTDEGENNSIILRLVSGDKSYGTIEYQIN